MNNELPYQIALTLTKNIGCVTAKKLIEHFGSASAIFKAVKKELYDTGIPRDAAESIKSFNDFSIVEKEIAFIEQYHIEPVFITQKHYPQRLLNCYDPPGMLYYKGNTDPSNQKIVSIVGTRSSTTYGKKITEGIIEKLSAQNILIISGLAYGIVRSHIKPHWTTVYRRSACWPTG